MVLMCYITVVFIEEILSLLQREAKCPAGWPWESKWSMWHLDDIEESNLQLVSCGQLSNTGEICCCSKASTVPPAKGCKQGSSSHMCH